MRRPFPGRREHAGDLGGHGRRSSIHDRTGESTARYYWSFSPTATASTPTLLDEAGRRAAGAQFTNLVHRIRGVGLPLIVIPPEPDASLPEILQG